MLPYSGKLLQVQTFATMPPEAPEEIFTVLIFATKACIASAVLTGLLKLLAVFIFAAVGSSTKTMKVYTMWKFPSIRYVSLQL